MYYLVKRLLFLFPPERAHYLAMGLLRMVLGIPLLGRMVRPPSLNHEPVSCMGLSFPNRLGLAAGFDKDARWLKELFTLGFGFIEIGTVTPRPQRGNPAPRLFRIHADRALLNRMGFNNEGADAVAARLSKFRSGTGAGYIVGGNIGKNKDTPNEEAASDYVVVFEKLYPYVDYFVVNVSSPNTPNLRALQEKDALSSIIDAIQQKEVELLSKGGAGPKPLLLKIAPDLSDEALVELAELSVEAGLSGIVATNTTTARNVSMPQTAVEKLGSGGLSGAPLRERANEVLKKLKSAAPQKTYIGVGGISSGEDAVERLRAGADLIQIYTGFIYEGPGLVRSLRQI